MLRMRTLPAGFIAPCLPTKTDKLPSGSEWLHEIKHDGFRIIARKDGPECGSIVVLSMTSPAASR
jgi:ATP-dependent DNA ligase